MKILLFGKNGQVGWELQRSLAPLGELIALSSSSEEFCGDLDDLAGIQQTIRQVSPDIIVNAAAYTAVDKAESEPERAYALNAQAPAVLAQEAKRLNAWLIHYSTDYVFNGRSSQPYLETDDCDPLNVYGESKLEGEKSIRSSGCLHLIFRTSWVYAAYGNNFIKTILHLAQQRDKLTIVDDQIGSPTGAELIADITAHALRMIEQKPKVSGLYHLTASGNTSWYGFAKFILENAERANYPLKIQSIALQPIASSDFPLPAKRPFNSRLNTEKLTKNFALVLPSWQTGAARTLTELLNNK
ncbi:dTDP-4-dehydrorhamnose reductase [Nitrosomonas oligotropha]|uniref:dTDP-4-dehydrorhamnose reductase n=1 Tax=Nitrosomonas oligotropha TaxID=42354 RepID=UPI00136B0C53|nr:dTDP-4-dehydrorhamnose reductase [Nitrosomonas oligotropha]MXS83505.1 dTDP-4-dehydrorhamnose reductase [Nitrosomonas oligotropha]